MAAVDPAKKLASEISSLRMKFNTLEQNVWLASVRDTVEDTQTAIKGFAGKVAELRTRGYVFGKNFEARAEALLKKWQPLAPNINKEIEEQARQLQTAIAPVRTRMTQLAASANNPAQAQSLLTQVKPQVESLEAQVTAVGRQIGFGADRGQPIQ